MSDPDVRLWPSYALSRHVPAMEHGFEVVTTYGPWHISGELAKQMADLLRQSLQQELHVAAKAKPEPGV